ncbi:MAG TPA: hypothetical protein VG815_13595 [Chloroflexota bacterium]|jgi:hypothetical protein|nr:hypothetical protein [Chloroflexota bacterium]
MPRRLVVAVTLAVVTALSSVLPSPLRAQQAPIGVNGVRWNYTRSMAVAVDYLAAATAPCPGRHAKHSCVYSVGGTSGVRSNVRQAEAFNPATGAWNPIAKLPESDPDLAAAAGPCYGRIAGTCVYAMGGAANRGVEMYDPSTNIWRQVASMRVAREDSAAAAAPCRTASTHTCLYVIGGGTGTSGDFIASTEMYDPMRNIWSNVTRLHTARQLLAAVAGPCRGVAAKTCVYAIGGIAGIGNPVASVEMFNPAKNVWTAVAGLPVPRYSFGAATGPCAPASSRTCVYAIGGSAKPIPCGPTTCYTAVNSVDQYDPAANRWTVVTPMNAPRQHLAATAGPCPARRGTCLYAVGGEADPSGGELSSVEVYGGPGLPNLPGAWGFVSSLNIERAGLAGAAAPCARDAAHTCLYAAGGVDQKGRPLSSAEMYDPRRAQWITVRSLPGPRLWAAAAAAPCHLAGGRDCLYVVGGLDRRGNAVASVENYDPRSARWAAVAPLATALFYPGVASGPCRGAVLRTCLYVVAGSDHNSVPVKSAEMFDPTTGRWAPVAALPAARSGLSAAPAPCAGHPSSACLYAVGGYNSGGQPTKTVFMYNPIHNSWSAASALRQPRYGLAATGGPCPKAPTATCLYALGGIGVANSTLGSGETYSAATGRWIAAPPMNVAREQVVAAAAPCSRQAARTCLYAIGGTTGPNQDVLPTVESFQPSG